MTDQPAPGASNHDNDRSDDSPPGSKGQANRSRWRLDGKVALVTGGAQGIGRGIALRLAAEGADIALNALKDDGSTQAVALEIEALGRRCLVLPFDVTDLAAADSAVTHCWDQLGAVDVLINNAGIERRAPFLEVTETDYDAVLAVNLKAPFFMAQAVAQRWQRAGRGGKIINISSVHEELPFPHFAPYCVAKGGLKMMMRDLAIELAPLGITVNNIAPGAIETPINAHLLETPDLLKPLLANIPQKRLGKPADVAALAVFLASADADYITGTTSVVDGGLLWNYSEQ